MGAMVKRMRAMVRSLGLCLFLLLARVRLLWFCEGVDEEMQILPRKGPSFVVARLRICLSKKSLTTWGTDTNWFVIALVKVRPRDRAS